LGVIADYDGAWEQAAARFAESLALMRDVGDRGGGDRGGIATALNNLGNVAVFQGDLARAADAFAEALELFRAGGERGGVAVGLNNLGWVARKQGAVAQAETLHREALALAREQGDARVCAEGLEHLATTAGAAGQGARAARLLGAAVAVREMLGAPQPPQERADTEAAVAPARAALGEASWAAAYAVGHALTLEAASAEALGEVD
jgi:tetratricopeptide (TPR) repeat protein